MEAKELADAAAGLCATCRHAQAIVSSKGSVFLLCGLSKTDPRFPKYPQLPVLSCAGYQRRTHEGPDSSSSKG
jgi:hypothetical protein